MAAKKRKPKHTPKAPKLDLEDVPALTAPPGAPAPHAPKFTVAIGDKICTIVRRGNFRDMAVAQVGISRQTMYNWIRWGGEGKEPYAAFLLKLEQAESEAEDVLVVHVRQQAKLDWRAAAWLLERRGSKRWGYKASVEFTVDEALEDLLDVAAGVLGGEQAAKLFTALASRGIGRTEAGASTGGRAGAIGSSGAGSVGSRTAN
jgi:hypothetical protein